MGSTPVTRRRFLSVLRFVREEGPQFLKRDIPAAIAADLMLKAASRIFEPTKEHLDQLQKTTRHQRADLIADLFFSGGASDVAPALYKPQAKYYPEGSLPSRFRLDDEVDSFSMDYYVLDQIRNLFPDQSFQLVDTSWAPDPNKSLVCTGGADANNMVAEIFGDVPDLSKGEEIETTVKTAEGTIRLPYVIALLSHEPIVQSMQNGVETYEPVWAIAAAAGRTSLIPWLNKGELDEDYLLVTRIPGQRRRGTSITTFSGLHGTGTRAAARILARIEESDLMRLVDLLQKENTPYFQAVFHATDLRPIGGDAVAQEVRCLFDKFPPVALRPD